jgi:prepilin-type N-terminal cleavage/methylation domain-containing protein
VGAGLLRGFSLPVWLHGSGSDPVDREQRNRDARLQASPASVRPVYWGGAWAGRNPWHREKGFTLLETVIAMGVFASVLMSLPGLLLVMERIENENTVRSRVLLCAQEKMEELKCASLHGNLTSGEGEEVFGVGPNQGMERRWAVRVSPRAQGLRQVSTECIWPDKRGGIRQEIETLMVERD